MALGAHLHATWNILAFVPNSLGPKFKHAICYLKIGNLDPFNVVQKFNTKGTKHLYNILDLLII